MVRDKVTQVQMEIHFESGKQHHIAHFWEVMVNTFHLVPFHKEPNIEFGGEWGIAVEMSFLNANNVTYLGT